MTFNKTWQQKYRKLVGSIPPHQIEGIIYYDLIRTKLLLWNCAQPAICFFIANKQICAPKRVIKLIKQATDLPTMYLHEIFKPIKVNAKVYQEYSRLIHTVNTNEGNLHNLKCIDVMKIMKNMGNELLRIKFNQVALTLYTLGTTKYQNYEDATHTNCDDCCEHDNMLAGLYNNISIIYFHDKNYEKSLFYAKKAITLNPHHISSNKRILHIKTNIINNHE